jgi:hypothetical protein
MTPAPRRWLKPCVQERGAWMEAQATQVGFAQGGRGPAAGGAKLRQRSAELKKKATSVNEKATIEIVALMFQAILQEDRIPPAIRVWFARLQMPVLRVALAEPDFFGTMPTIRHAS